VEGHGFDRQEEACRAYAKKAGYEIVGTFQEEGVSGAKDETERPAFQEMMAAILVNGVRTVIVEGMDRLARELRVQEALLVYMAAKGVDLLSARTEENVTQAIQADPMKKALVQIQGVFAELDKNLAVKRLRKARDAKSAEHKKTLRGPQELRTDPRGAERHPADKGHEAHPEERNPGMAMQEICDRLNFDAGGKGRP
jgi:site-specific DNA recombinase